MLYKHDDNGIENFLSFQQGEERGFNYFYNLYYKPLVHFAFTLVKNTGEAEDIVEDSFVKFWQKRTGIEKLQGVKSWLYTTVRNASFNVLEKQNNRKAYAAQLKNFPPATLPDIQQNIIIAESMHQVYLALQNLSPKYQQVFKMLYVEGREVKDIAKELNLPLSTVKSQKAKTLELLRKQLPHLGILMIVIFGN